MLISPYQPHPQMKYFTVLVLDNKLIKYSSYFFEFTSKGGIFWNPVGSQSFWNLSQRLQDCQILVFQSSFSFCFSLNFAYDSNCIFSEWGWSKQEIIFLYQVVSNGPIPCFFTSFWSTGVYSKYTPFLSYVIISVQNSIDVYQKMALHVATLSSGPKSIQKAWN